MVASKVTVKSKLPIDAILRELAEQPKHVAIGVLGSKAAEQHKGAPAGVTVAQVAHWNHYGTSNIPPRPFLDIALFRASPQASAGSRTKIGGRDVNTTLRRIGRGIFEGKVSMDLAYELVGQVLVSAVQQAIADGVPPPNAPSTIARKGSSTPLIDKGQLRASISYEVREGSVADGVG